MAAKFQSITYNNISVKFSATVAEIFECFQAWRPQGRDILAMFPTVGCNQSNKIFMHLQRQYDHSLDLLIVTRLSPQNQPF